MKPRILENMEIIWFVAFNAFSRVSYFSHIFSICFPCFFFRILGPVQKYGKNMEKYGKHMEIMWKIWEIWKTYGKNMENIWKPIWMPQSELSR